MRYILIILFTIVALSTKAQFTGTDSLRNYNNRYITTNPATAFTNNRLNTLLRGIIDFIDTARAGGGGAITLGIDTIYAVNDSTIRYRKNGVFRQFTLKGVYDYRRKVDTIYTVNDTTLRFTINGQVRNVILPGSGSNNTIAKSAQTADGNYIQDWSHKWLYFNNLNSLTFTSDDPDPNHPDNRKLFQLYADSTIDNYPLRIMWGLKNVNNDATDSLHFEMTSLKDSTYLHHFIDGGNKSIKLVLDPNMSPSANLYANGGGKNGYYELGASVATIQPNDSVKILAVAAANADSVLAIRALNNGLNTVVKIPKSAVGGGADSADFSTNYRRDTAIANVRSQKANKIRLSEYGILSDADISYGSSSFGTDQTSAIQAILNTASPSNPLYLIWDVKISTTGLQIKSYTTIECTQGSGAILRDNSDEFLLRSYRWETPFTSIDSNVNITIIGGLWNGNGYRGGVAKQIHSDSAHGLMTGFNFGGCKNIKLQDVKVINARTYALMFITIENLYIDNLQVDQSNGALPAINQDGMDIIGYANNIVIKNSRFTCGDDRIAFGCNAAGGVFGGENHYPYTGVNGDQTHIRIDNLKFESWGQGLRFNSSANKIEDVIVSNITGVARGYWLVADNFDNLAGYDFEPGPGDMRKFVFENIHIEVDTFFSYQNPDQFPAAAMIGCNFDFIEFKNIIRNSFRKIQYSYTKPIPSFAVTNGSITVKDLFINGYKVYDTSTVITNHIFCNYATVSNLRLNNVNINRDSATNTSSLIKLGPNGTITNVILNGVKTKAVDHMLLDSGVVNSLSAVNIYHANTTAATFVNALVPAVPIALSNYIGTTKTSGNFSPTTGDAYPTIGTLENTLLAGSTTGATPITYTTSSGSNRNVDISAANIDDNFAALAIRPTSGTDVASELFFAPRGNGYSGIIKTGASFFGTNYFADPNNFYRLLFRTTDTSHNIIAEKFGTETVRPINFFTSGVRRMQIGVSGGVIINNPYDNTSYTLPTARASAGQVLTDVSGNGSLSWQTPSGGVTSINSHTGPAITVQGGTGISVDNSVSNTVTFNVTPSSSALPHTLDAVYTTAGNTSTTETDLYSYTLPAGQLGIDGRTINFEIDGEFNDNTITAQLKLYFAGNVMLNTGAVSVSTAFTKWKLTGYVMRTSSSTAHVTYELQAPGLATTVFLGYSNLTSLDFTTTNVFKISAQAAGGGASNSDITAHSWQLLYKPQPQ